MSTLELDHIAIAGESLEEARSFVEEALGVPLQPGGEHAVFNTHNALLGLEDGLYLEAIAINPGAPTPDRPRWFDLDNFEGSPKLTNWICQSRELSEIIEEIDLDLGFPVDLQRGDLRWQMAVPENGRLPFDNCAPAVMSWQTGTHPAARLTPRGVRLRRLTVSHPQAGMLADYLRPYLSDDRILIETGAPGLSAGFETPHGPRELSR